jgi:hypothetical protein
LGHRFLTDEWFDAIHSLVAAAGELEVPEAIRKLRLNVAIVDAPEGVHSMHMAGSMLPQKGVIKDAVATLRMPYPLARKLLIERDQGAAIQAFMSGKIQIEGDMSALMSMGSGLGPGNVSANAQKLQQQILELTE